MKECKHLFFTCRKHINSPVSATLATTPPSHRTAGAALPSVHDGSGRRARVSTEAVVGGLHARQLVAEGAALHDAPRRGVVPEHGAPAPAPSPPPLLPAVGEEPVSGVLHTLALPHHALVHLEPAPTSHPLPVQIPFSRSRAFSEKSRCEKKKSTYEVFHVWQ